MRIELLTLLILSLICARAGEICVPDPCDVCNSQQVCSAGQCQSSGGVSPCEGVTCGANAVCRQGVCQCNHGFTGDANAGCILITTTKSPFEKLISERDWDIMLPRRWYVSESWKRSYSPLRPWFYPEMNTDYFSYRNFVDAYEMMADHGFSNFLNEPGTSEEDKKRELCAFIANIGHETGYGKYREELSYERTDGHLDAAYRSVGSRSDYRMGTEPVYFRPGAKLTGIRFKTPSYHGRGPLQLSWGYNYGDYSKVVYGEPQKLLENPDILLYEPIIGISSAIWFWMTQPDWRMTHNAHRTMYKSLSQLQPWGFGRTIMAINGGLEGGFKENGQSAGSQKVTRRIHNYRQCAKHFRILVGVDGEKLDTFGYTN